MKRYYQLNLILLEEIFLDLKDLSQSTDTNGIFITSVPKIKSTESVQKIEVGINFQSWLNEGSDSEFIKKLFKSIINLDYLNLDLSKKVI